MLAPITQKRLKPQKQKLVTWFLRPIGNFYKKTNFSLKPTVFKIKIQTDLFFGAGVFTLITQKRLKIPTWNLVTCFVKLLGNFFLLTTLQYQSLCTLRVWFFKCSFRLKGLEHTRHSNHLPFPQSLDKWTESELRFLNTLQHPSQDTPKTCGGTSNYVTVSNSSVSRTETLKNVL